MSQLVQIFHLNFRSFGFSDFSQCNVKLKHLESNLDLTEVITELVKLMPQLKGFIADFNSTINLNNINVFTDTGGNMSVDVPHDMPQVKAEQLAKKIGIIDKLIANHNGSISDLFEKGFSLEKDIKSSNPDFQSELKPLLDKFKLLKDSYHHK